VNSPETERQAWLADRLLARRVVMLVGDLDDAAALRLSAELMTLDATGAEAIELHVASSGERVEAALMAIDTLDLVKAPTRGHALGEVGGTAVAVFASCRTRTAAPHAGFLLREPMARFTGTAEATTAHALQQTRMLERFRERFARATGRSVAQIAEDLRRGRYLDAREAADYGLVSGDSNRGGAAAPNAT